MGGLPDGRVTFCFTDIEGSTALLAAVGQATYAAALEEHRSILRSAWADHNGAEVGTEGDSFFVAFADAADAARACAAGQRALASHRFTGRVRVKVRMGLHTGEAHPDATGSYTAMAVHQAARIANAAHGGQVVASPSAVTGTDPWRSLGLHRVRDFDEPVEIFQLLVDGLEDVHPPLRSVQPLEPWAAVPLPSWLRGDAMPFAGRTQELAVLTSALDAAASGQRRAVLVAGEPGAGKTRVVAEAVGHVLRRGGVVLGGRCDPNVAMPYGPFTEAFDRLIASMDAEVLVPSLGRDPTELVRVAPQLATAVPAPDGVADDEARWRVFAAVADALATLSAPGGLALVLDDMQWATPSTVALLGHLLRTELAAKLAIVVTYRDTDLLRRSPLSIAVHDLLRLPGVERLTLGGLDAAALGELVANATGRNNPQLAARLAADTAGNPFFAGEVLRGLADGADAAAPLPEGVRAAIGHRLDQLDDDVVDVLRAAAVVGQDFTIAVVTAAADVDAERCLEHLERAARSRMVRDLGGDRFRFEHALVRMVLYDELSPSRRARRHRRVAEWLEVAGAPAAELAHHWESASGPDAAERAILHLRAAADAASSSAAFDHATELLQHARDIDDGAVLGEADRLSLLVQLGRTQNLAGDASYAATLLDAARRARVAGAVPQLADALVALTMTTLRGVAATETDVIALLEDAVDHVTEPPVERARLCAALAFHLSFSAPYERRRALVDEALALVTSEDALSAQLEVSFLSHLPRAVPQAHEDRWRESATALDLALREGGPSTIAGIAYSRIMTALERGDIDEAERAHGIMGEVAPRAGAPVRWMWTYFASTLATLRGDTAEGERLAAEAFALGAAEGEAPAVYLGQTLAAHWQRGTLAEAIPLWELVDIELPLLSALRVLALLSRDQPGDRARAEQLFAPYRDGGFALPEDMYWLEAMLTFSFDAARLGDRTSIEQLIELLEPYPRLVGVIGATVETAAAHALGELYAALDRFDEAEAYFAIAVEVHQRMRAPFPTALSQAAWAAVAHRRGDRAKARQLATEARRLATAGDFRAVATAADAILDVDR